VILKKFSLFKYWNFFMNNNKYLLMRNKILITGGDGFIGWPLALRMSKLKWDVLIVDNLSRRKID
jgi:hypothetical protein